MDKPMQILDCTLRDGGYLNGWAFDRDLAGEICAACAKSGVDIFEVGYLSQDQTAPLCRRCDPEFVAFLRRRSGSMRLSAMLEADTLGQDFGGPGQSGLDILRVALNRDRVEDSLPKIKKYHDQGYQIFLQLMGITGYSPEELDRVLEAVKTSGGVDVVSLGDSYGSLLPQRTGELVTLVREKTGLPVGLHAHNNMQLGMANVLSALEAGARVVDGSIYGMGRGGGNVPTELMVTFFEKQDPARFHSLPLLELIDRRMLRLHREHPWGYSLAALISGVYECHPYYTSRLIEKREYTIGQVLKTAQLVDKSQVVGFDSGLLTAIVEGGFSAQGMDAARKAQAYLDEAPTPAYYNAHPGRNFLILGSGPTIRTYREEILAYIRQKDPIILGANRLEGLPVPHYHAFNNQRRFEQYASQVSHESTLLLGPGVQATEQSRPWLRLECLNSSQTPLELDHGAISSNCRSIAVLLGAVALVMGAGLVAFAGLDGYELPGEKLYYREEETSCAEDLLEKHQANQHYLLALKRLASDRDVLFRFLTPTTYQL